MRGACADDAGVAAAAAAMVTVVVVVIVQGTPLLQATGANRPQINGTVVVPLQVSPKGGGGEGGTWLGVKCPGV